MTSTVPLSWHSARSFDELLRLARRFVLGEIDSFPGWGSADLDDETDELEDVLLAANDAGMLTVASQPGRPFSAGHDGWQWTGRAFVGGFVRAEVLLRLRERAGEQGLVVLGEGPGVDSPAFSVPAGLRDGLPYLVLGTGGRAEELEIFLKEAGEGAQQALQDLPFVWLVDPVWGRRDALRNALDASAA